MNDLVTTLRSKLAKLNQAIDVLAVNGRERSKAEMDYRIGLRQEILREREKGTPVTIISDVCRGQPEIAKLKFERDVAEAVHQANLEAINVWKLEIRVLESQLGREWGRPNA